MPASPIPLQNHSTGLSSPNQLFSKPNSSPQRTQSSIQKKVSHTDQVIMLSGPEMDTFETQVECLANIVTPTNPDQGRERTVF